MQGVDLALRHGAVGLRYEHEKVEQLQTLRVVHVLRYLGARLAYGVLERRFAHLLLSFEEAQKYLLALAHGYLAEVAAQEGAHKLHLGVHHPAVGFHDVRGEHEQREEERVALALILLLG